MNIMDIQTEKLKLIELLLHTNNPSIIERIKTVFQTEESQDIWEELTDKQKVEIELAMKEVRKGQTIPFETFLERHK
jgi:predicted Zn-ribbon and HTH transcriptional regulator